jgi:class 3 adenylate cyclase/tetratricopeptide (TPR) repeat protein
MLCPRCQQENPAQARFCMKCGAGLAKSCGQCGTELPGAAVYCFACGQPVGTSTSAPRFAAPESYTPKHLAEKILTSRAALEGERKQVTVLFADLKGSMELLADRDPEEARKLLDPVLERMMEAVHRYEGTVNQVMGDGIMALFGAPIAHEDHAVRACYAALRMQEQIQRYAEQARREHGALIHVRVGVNSGEVVVRSVGSDLRLDYTAVGQTTHLAARMEQMAMPGSILITAGTLGLAEGYVEVEPLGPVPIKGLPAPAETYEVRGAGRVRTRLQASAARGLSRFVGRDAEMEQLRTAQEQAAAGHGQVVAVVGEPGVGKSRLFYEFIHSHRTRGWLVLESASVSYGKATAYLPVIDLLKSYFRIEPRDDARTMTEKVGGKVLMLDRTLEDTIPAVLALLDTLPEDSPFRALEPPDRRRRSLQAIKALLLRESRVQPLVLVFEDLHWIDGETQAILDSLIDSLPAVPILLLVNYRPEYQHGWGSRTCYRQLRIDPLGGESADELLGALLGADPSLDALKRLLLERTQGNPFFLEESVRALLEIGALSGERGAHRLTRPVTALQVPASVQALLASRIDRLAAEDKQLLETASAIGKDVPYPLLVSVAGGEEGVLQQRLGRLQGAEFLYETRLFPEAEYSFKHALTHEVAYAGLVLERRRAVHARIVEAIERIHAGRLEEQIEALAHHTFRAERWGPATRLLRQAGDRARERSANREAAVLYEQALVALSHVPEGQDRAREALEIRASLRLALIPLADFRTFLPHLQAMEADATALGDERWRARIMAWRSECLRVSGEHAAAATAGERALGMLRSHGGDAVDLAAASFQVALTYIARGRYRAAAQLLGESATLLKAAPLQQQLRTADVRLPNMLGQQAICLATLGEFEGAVARGTEAVALAETPGFVARPLGLIVGLNGLGVTHLMRGDAARAAPLLERGRTVALERDVALAFGFTCSALGYARALQGRNGEALALIEEAIVQWAAIGRVTSARHRWLLAAAYLSGHRPDYARTAVEEALELARRHGERGNEAEALRVLGECAAAGAPPDPATARQSFEQALALAEELGMRPLVAHCHLGLGKLYWRTDKRHEAQEHLATATTMYREMDMRFWLEQTEAEMRELTGMTRPPARPPDAGECP